MSGLGVDPRTFADVAQLARRRRTGNGAVMPRTALYTGTFDPVTNGHLDVVRRACRLVDRLVIGIGVHSAKAPVFSADERAEMLREVCGPVAAAEGTALEVVTFYDLAVAAAKRLGATIVIRGLRDGTDLDYEMQMAAMNEAWLRDLRPSSPGLAGCPPHHRHPGAPDRGHGRRRLRLRAGARQRAAEGDVRLALKN